MGTEFYHADGQTDVTNLIAAFRNFASAPKMLIFKNVTNENANIKVTTFKNTDTQADQMHRAVWQAVSRTTKLQDGPREKLVLLMCWNVYPWWTLSELRNAVRFIVLQHQVGMTRNLPVCCQSCNSSWNFLLQLLCHQTTQLVIAKHNTWLFLFFSSYLHWPCYTILRDSLNRFHKWSFLQRRLTWEYDK